PTVGMYSPSLAEIGSPIKPTKPLQVSSNEKLDVSTIKLGLTPSLGAQPGVKYTKKDGALYVYEFILDGSLAPGTTYDGSVTGGEDLAGNLMNPFTFSFSTEAVADITGLDTSLATSTDTELVSASIDVIDAFDKWQRALTNKDLGQLTSIMTGDFIFEPNPAEGTSHADVNFDGVLSLTEFKDMMKQGFLMWEQCSTTLTATIVENAAVDTSTGEASVVFSLSGTSTNTSYECSDANMEPSNIYVSLREENGAWLIYRVSDGFDSRGEPITYKPSVAIVEPANGSYWYLNNDGPPMVCADPSWDMNDGSLDPANCSSLIPGKLEWQEVANASAYILIIRSVTNEGDGFAMALAPTNKLDFADPGSFENGAKVDQMFGFNGNFEPIPGEILTWQIAALEQNTVNAIKNGRNTDLSTDILAMSKQQRLKLWGEYRPLVIRIYADTNNDGAYTDGTDTLISYSDFIGGYDAGSANNVIIQVDSPNPKLFPRDTDNDGTNDQPDINYDGVVDVPELGVEAHGFSHHIVSSPFDLTATVPTAQVVLSLDRGFNEVQLFDMSMLVDCGAGCSYLEQDWGNSMRKFFRITTSVGNAPPVTISAIADGTVTNGTLDTYGFYNSSTGTTTITVTGTAKDAAGVLLNNVKLNINAYNDRIGGNSFTTAQTDAVGVFTFTMDIYEGHNWINIGQECGPNGCGLQYSFGVYTDTGAVWVPPIEISGVTETAGTATLTATETWGNGARYDASTLGTDTITISGNMINGQIPEGTDCYSGDSSGCPWWDVGSDGGWQGGNLTVQPNGDFSIEVDLYTGYNHVNIRDSKGNSHHIEVYTTAGYPVIKPSIVAYSTDSGANWTPYTSGVIQVSTCSVTLKGEAEHGELRAWWNGSYTHATNGPQYFWEERFRVVDDSHGDDNNATDGKGYFEFTMPVTSGTNARNNIDINDAKWRWLGLSLSTTGSCEFTPPVMTFTDIQDGTGTTLSPDLTNPGYTWVDGSVVTTATVKIVGTTDPNRDVKAEAWVCGRQKVYEMTSDATTGAFTLDVNVYQGGNGINITDGYNYWSVDLQNVNNNQTPVPTISVGVTGTMPDTSAATITPNWSDCSYASMDVGGAQSVTLTGQTIGSDGTGNFDVNGVRGTFTITGGNFTINLSSAEGLYIGFNRVQIYDAQWNTYGLELQNANSGTPAPQFVDINLSSLDGGTTTNAFDDGSVVGDTTVNSGADVMFIGTVNKTAKAGFTYTVHKMRGFMSVCDSTSNCSYTYFSSDPNDGQWGDEYMEYDATTGEFRLSNVVFTDGNTQIEVYAEGELVEDADSNNRSWMGPGERVFFNTDTNVGSFWKGGAAKPTTQSINVGRQVREFQNGLRQQSKQ
ncbi:MAG: hypothetical protein OEY38_17745, partial [Gammaproteobacteria bacterium]|nr:hypothetical protein [Gammaproteobacteria bacterium]